MLPPFIIDQIRKREEEERHIEEQPVLEIPVPPRGRVDRAQDDDADRGVVVIDLFG